jgi:NOL1/NOP2/fmu family ribosome biogenesis protein
LKIKVFERQLEGLSGKAAKNIRKIAEASLMNYKILNSREKKEIMHHLKEQYDFSEQLEYVFLQKKDGKIYIINRDVEKIMNRKLYIDSMGLYFAEIDRHNQFRISFEGSMIIGPFAKKNVAEIDQESARVWLKGEDIDISDAENLSRYVLVKHKTDYMGSGKIKDGKISNFVPKTRRILCD